MTETAPKPQLPAPARLDSIDAYRGLVMFLMMAEVLELRHVAKALVGNSFWEFLAYHQTHVEWAGCSLHDLIQPSFSFLVGTSLAFSIAAREARGQGFGRMALHAAWRALLLVWLGVFLRSVNKPQTYFTFVDTLSQIGLGYFPLFLLGFVRQRWLVVVLVVILVAYWGAFALYAPPADFSYSAVGVPPDWHNTHNYSGFAAHWNKNNNPGWAVDTWFLNLFPTEETFTYNNGGYATLNFIPTLATMILGLMAGNWLRADSTSKTKLGRLVLAGAATMVLGLAADWTGLCPVVKRIWTPSWTLYSGGWCFFILAGFYALMDMGGWKAWAYPLKVIGANSIVAYVLAHIAHEPVVQALHTHLGKDFFRCCGEAYEPLLTGAAVLVIWWLMLLWLYRQRIFVRI
jgi:predicted acyltransferase